jgi:hypothetical protein
MVVEQLVALQVVVQRLQAIITKVTMLLTVVVQILVVVDVAATENLLQ